VVPVARVVEIAFDPVQQAVDAEGKLVAHAHDDRVGLVPVLTAQMSERLAMLFGGPDHEAHIPSSRSTQRPAVEKDLDTLPEFEAQRPEQPVFGIPDARWFSAADGAQGKRDVARFFVDLRPSPRIGPVERIRDGPQHLRGADLRIPGNHAVLEAGRRSAGGHEKGGGGDDGVDA